MAAASRRRARTAEGVVSFITHTPVMHQLSPEQRRSNLRLALITLSIAVALLVGFILRWTVL